MEFGATLIFGEGAIKVLPGLIKPDIIEATAAHCPGWGMERNKWQFVNGDA